MKMNQNHASLWLTVCSVALAGAIVACGSGSSSKKGDTAPTQTTIGTGFAANSESGQQTQTQVKVVPEQSQQPKQDTKPTQVPPSPNQGKGGKGCKDAKQCGPTQGGPGQNPKHQHPGQFDPVQISCSSQPRQYITEGLPLTCNNGQVCALSANVTLALTRGVCISLSNCLNNDTSGHMFFSEGGKSFLQVWGDCSVSLFD